MGDRLSQPELSAQPSVEKRESVPLLMCGAKPTDVVHAEHWVEELWRALDQTLENSDSGVGSDLPKGEGGTLDPVTLEVHVAPAPRIAHDHGASAPTIVQVEGPRIPGQPVPPPPPEYLPDMKDAIAITNSIHALSPRIVVVHGPTRRGKSTVFPLAAAHWTYVTPGLKPGAQG